MSSKTPPAPAKPTPPLSRYIRNDWPSGVCKKCASTVERKYIIFGERKCIHPECGEIQ